MFKKLAKVISGVKFIDGIEEMNQAEDKKDAA